MSATHEANAMVNLYSEFAPHEYDAWKETVIAELKGGDFEKKLIWKSPEGIDVQPLYTRRDVEKLPHLGFDPGCAPFVRGTTPLGGALDPWRINQTCHAHTAADAADEIRNAAAAGQTGVTIVLDDAGRCGPCGRAQTDDRAAVHGTWLQTLDETTVVLDAARTSGLPVDIDAGCSAPVMLAHAAIAAAHEHQSLCGGILMDPIAMLAETGTLPAAAEDVHATLAAMIRFARGNDCTLRFLSASAEPWHNAGATIAQELACTLGAGVRYMHALIAEGVSAGDAATSIRFTFPVGTNFFFEIAKLRAARMLWAKIVRAFGVESESALAMDMHVCTSRRHMSSVDPYVNMLRTTVEALAGAIGGTASLQTLPFDAVIGEPTVFSTRIARNTQLVLREEAHMTKVVDPAAGSYYVEVLTDRIGRDAWAIFQRIEAAGGLTQAMRAGTIQTEIEAAAAERRDAFSKRRDVLIGVNQYPNLTERPLTTATPDVQAQRTEHDRRMAEHRAARDEAEVRRTLEAVSHAATGDRANMIEAIMAASAAGATRDELLKSIYPIESAPGFSVRPLVPMRIAERFERIRRSVEACDPRPTAYLATFGPVVWRRARAGFASGFLGAGGFAVTDMPGFGSAEEAAAAAVASGAEIVVLCSDDESYPVAGPLIAGEVKKKRPEAIVIVAGFPKDAVEALKQAGVDEFIHVRSDAGAVLEALCARLGVNGTAQEGM